MKLKKLKKRVDRGVKLLDKKKPKWWKKVDLKKLDLNSNDLFLNIKLFWF